MKAVKVGALKAFVVAIKSAHHARPGPAKYKVALAFALNHVSVLIEQFRLHAEEWKALWVKESAISDTDQLRPTGIGKRILKV